MSMTFLPSAWKRYWFSPAPCFDLAVVRIITVAVHLFSTWYLVDAVTHRAALPDENWEPLIILKLMNLPFGWGFRPSPDVLQTMDAIRVVAGVLALVGLLTNLSLAVLAFTSVYLQAFVYSFGDFHHPQAVTMIALSVLAVSPSGRVLSVDSVLRGGRRAWQDMLAAESEFAGWPIRLLQWFFVLMYLSAVWSKLWAGHDWPNGFTLQYYLIHDGLRWNSPFALWLSQFHTLIWAGQLGVVAFQATFCLAVIFPILRWIYVPAGLALHTFIFLSLKAPFFGWMALYSVFIPWRDALRLVVSKAEHGRAVSGEKAEAGLR
jgi:uncharacterized membrane protein YphA (DoxX/SURF4 family)